MKRFLLPLLGAIMLVVAGGCSRNARELNPSEKQGLAAVTLPESVLRAVKARGQNLRRLTGSDAETNQVDLDGVAVAVPQQDARETIRALRKEVGPGFLVFRSEQNFGAKPDVVAVMRGTDQLDALRAMGTNADNHDISREQIIKKIQAWDQAHGLDIIGAGFD